MSSSTATDHVVTTAEVMAERHPADHGERIRVLIADDDPVFRQGLRAVLERHGGIEVVGEAASGDDLAAGVQRSRPDLVLADLRMPGNPVLGVIATLKRQLPRVRVVVFSTFGACEDIHRALQAGAAGYLLKGGPLPELLAAVRAVCRGQLVLPADVQNRLSRRLPGSQLSSRECAVLGGIAAGRTNREIGRQLGITEGTIKWYVNQILGKLAVANRAEAVAAAVEQGILRIAP